jgi:hypothetical protein
MPRPPEFLPTDRSHFVKPLRNAICAGRASTGHASGLTEERAAALEECAEIELDLGQHTSLVPGGFTSVDEPVTEGLLAKPVVRALSDVLVMIADEQDSTAIG